MYKYIKEMINFFSEVSLEHVPCYSVISVVPEPKIKNTVGVYYVADFDGEWRLAYCELSMNNVVYADIGEFGNI